tara:strand:+ start:826 stop:2139 length:1314 start_codon:yes stop_codon:yes gene_type:complete
MVSALLLVGILAILFQIGSTSKAHQDTESGPISSAEDQVRNLYDGYTNIVAQQIESRIDGIFNELAILRSINQTYIDQSEDMESITDAFKSNPVTRDKLSFNGKWYQNSPDEQNVVMVHRHLLDENGQIKAEVQRDLDNTIMLDLVLESFHKNGVDKQLTYAQGGLNKSFTRMYPWVDLGTLFYEVYPAFIDTSIWDAFNPGLVDAFEKRIREEEGVKEDPNKLARVLLPVQDGVTGEVIMTFTSPVFDPERENFRGTVAFDVNMSDITKLVEELVVSEAGFPFLAQSSGNVFAINSNGAQVLGLSHELDSLEVTGEGVGFNRLERMLSDSVYESVQNLTFPTDSSTDYNLIDIDGQSYVVILKTLKPFQVWVPNDWFKEESWTLGLVIPASEVAKNSEQEVGESPSNVDSIYLILIAGASVCLYLIGIAKGTKVNN